MPKPSAFLREIERKAKRNMDLQRRFTLQQSEDMAIITLSQDFGFGEKRALEFREKFRETCKAYAQLCLDNAEGDQNMDYTKGCIDRELSRILGDSFQPWEERFPKNIYG